MKTNPSIPRSLLPHDLFTHRADWRRMLEQAAQVQRNCNGDDSYEQHQIKAFDAAFDRLDELTK